MATEGAPGARSWDRTRLRENLEGVRRRIERACARAGRNAGGVTLVVVTKYVPAEILPELGPLGVRDIGENRPLEGRRRVGALQGFRRHMVGHVQTNKVKPLLEWADVLHSLDRPALREELVRRGARLPVYVQINVSGESTKGGFRPEEAEAAVREAQGALEVAGLMTKAPEGADARPVFRRLRALAERAGVAGLSMGMSQDFEAAVEEGATAVRIGTAVFEGVFGV